MAKTLEKDNINPDHYKSQCSIECIEAMEMAFGNESVLNFCLCNAFKYLWRHENKGGIEDLKKAAWYIDRARTELALLPEYRGIYEEKVLAISTVILRYNYILGGNIK